MLKNALRDAFVVNREASRARVALPCLPAIAIPLLAGLVIGRPAIGMVAAGGAMSVGFGAFQRLGRSRTAPMLCATIGMSLTTAIGSLVPHNMAGLILNGAAAGFVYGMLSALGPGAAWIALQCAIVGLVATGYPTGVGNALGRAALILAGGFLQLGIVSAFRKLDRRFHPRAIYVDDFSGVRNAIVSLRENLRFGSPFFTYSLTLAATLGVSAGAARLLGLTNGYWVPMTALLVLRVDLRETVARGLARVAGTFIGAGLATLLASELRPNLLTLGALVLIFAWLCYSVVNVNYGAFSVSVTAYIAFLLSFAGLPATQVALHRLANTALGGLLALIAAAPGIIRSGKGKPTR